MTGTSTEFLTDVRARYLAIRQARGADHGLRLNQPALAPLSLVRLRLAELEEFTTASAVEQRMAALDARCTGWCRRESWVGRLPCSSYADLGPPLDGEWVFTGTSRSGRLSFAAGVWRLWTIDEAADGDVHALRQDVSLAANRGHTGGGTRGRLLYAVYWSGSADDPAGLRRIGSRFLGFDDGSVTP